MGITDASELGKEYEVKLAYLLNFARYTSWKSPADTPLRFCIYKDEEITSRLTAVSKGRLINERGLEVNLAITPEALMRCDLIFFPERVPGSLSRELVKSLQSNAILTVGEDSSFIDYGGAIRFLIKDGSVRFVVNLDNVRQGGLDLSSRLLQHAETVISNSRRAR